MNFKGKNIWITGASSGIGKQLAIDLNKAGANLILSARREKELEDVKNSFTNKDIRTEIVPLDLSKHESFPKIVEQVIQHFDKIDLLINNGGIGQLDTALNSKNEIERLIFDVNYFGTVFLTKQLLPYMIEQGGGQIAVISSLNGKFGSPRSTSYAASKHALHGYFDSLRIEVYKNNIAITLICPGFTKTDIAKNAFTGDGKQKGKSNRFIENGQSVKRLSKKTLLAISRKKEEVVIGNWEIIMVFLKRFFPKLQSFLIRKVM